MVAASPDLDFDRIFTAVCKENAAAKEFCFVFLSWAHFIDDTIDKDKPKPDLESVVGLNLQAAMCFAFNPFFQEHKASLLPLIIAGVKAFVDSLEWARRPDQRDRFCADVLKAQYQEVFWHVALLVGGYDHFDQVTKEFRHYHYDVTS